jgi:hypothetical protein
MSFEIILDSAAEEREERDQSGVGAEWERQDEGVGGGGLAGKQQEARPGEREDEDVHEQQVERKRPCHRLDIAFAWALHDEDVELPGQQDHRRHRHQQQRRPPRV